MKDNFYAIKRAAILPKDHSFKIHKKVIMKSFLIFSFVLLCIVVQTVRSYRRGETNLERKMDQEDQQDRQEEQKIQEDKKGRQEVRDTLKWVRECDSHCRPQTDVRRDCCQANGHHGSSGGSCVNGRLHCI